MNFFEEVPDDYSPDTLLAWMARASEHNRLTGELPYPALLADIITKQAERIAAALAINPKYDGASWDIQRALRGAS